eukprot:CAMPEP_0113557338 /NCGR_PEP_ID=MMETSP0015_2-20120614/17737_1 /TAXON_ID=2838 /ORGANISM="Odontella" /LENGTH=128 /DNA_ID=CAMNT_0000458755 /DNA_START=131 /DNA_END=517 /DNA_ORIENTATION=+ /assembly_acc=CAM_ASM_000160
MGLAASMLSLPVGAIVGCLSFHVSGNWSGWRFWIFPSLLVVGLLGMFLPLTILCARYDGTSVWESLQRGECWSTGGDLSYYRLGVAAGIFIGTGLTGTFLLQCKGGDAQAEEARGDGVTDYGAVSEGV